MIDSRPYSDALSSRLFEMVFRCFLDLISKRLASRSATDTVHPPSFHVRPLTGSHPDRALCSFSAVETKMSQKNEIVEVERFTFQL